MSISDPHTVDLSGSPPQPESSILLDEIDINPLSSFSSLATALDNHTGDIPSFLNDLLAPHLSSTPPGAPAKPPDVPALDKTLNSLSTRLSLLSQDTSSALEQSIHDISRTVPRLTYDLQFMRESATTLHSSLAIVQGQVARQHPNSAEGDSEEAKTFRSLESLTHLDKLKTRLEAARDILREAESWSTLEGEITGYISTSSWQKAGGRLAEAGRSMVVFQSTPGEYESRRTLLVSLQNELEGALAKALDSAIEKKDVEEMAKLREVFETIDRGGEFRTYYFSARRRQLVDEWNRANLSDSATGEVSTTAPKAKFTVFLPTWYTSFLSIISAEVTQIPLIFPPSSAPEILAAFLQTTLDALSPSLQTRLSSLADYHGPTALIELIRAYKSTEEMALSVQTSLDRLVFNTQGGILSGPEIGSPSASPSALSPTPAEVIKTPKSANLSLAKKRSRTYSLSRKFSRTSAISIDIPDQTRMPTEWETTLFEPFLDLQSTYASLERRFLSHIHRTDPALSAHGSKGEPSRALLDRANVAFGLLDEAIGRCMAFTHGYGAKGLLETIENFLENFFDEEKGSVLRSSKAKTGQKNAEIRDELDFEGLDYSTEDWEAFQTGLHVLTACRDLRARLERFEGRLHEALVKVNNEVISATPGPPSSALRETPLGAITLILQSILNSADLHSLMADLPETSSTMSLPLPLAREALRSFTRDSQAFLQRIILSPLQSQLEAYPNLPVWEQPDKAPKRGELQIPTFSLGPTDTIARVSEGLLNLLRVFEVYAADDSLGFSIETLPFVDADSIKEALRDNAGMMNGDGGLHPGTVLSTWVSSLSLSLLSHLTKDVLIKITALSMGGAAQLASDLAYLSNAVRALDVEWEDLERWKEAVGMEKEAEWKVKFREVREAGEGEDVWRRVGIIRGWS